MLQLPETPALSAAPRNFQKPTAVPSSPSTSQLRQYSQQYLPTTQAAPETHSLPSSFQRLQQFLEIYSSTY